VKRGVKRASADRQTFIASTMKSLLFLQCLAIANIAKTAKIEN